MSETLKYDLVEVNPEDFGLDIMDTTTGKLFRLKALKSFGKVSEGEFGGLVDSESILSQYGNCWVFDGCLVVGRVWIKDNAILMNSVETNLLHKDYYTVRGSAGSGLLLSGDTSIYNSSLDGVEGRIAETVLQHTKFKDCYVEINKSKISNSSINGNLGVKGVVIEDCNMLGATRIYGELSIYTSTLINTYIQGNTIFKGCKFIDSSLDVNGGRVVNLPELEKVKFSGTNEELILKYREIES